MFPTLQRVQASARSPAQCLQLDGVFDFTSLDQPQAFTKHFAGVLVTTRPDERLDELFLMFGQDDISGWNGLASAVVGILCHS